MVRQSRLGLLAPIEERVLSLMLLQPDREWYRSQLACELGLSASSLQRPLARLEATDILISRRSGNRVYYRANEQSPVYVDVQALLAKTSGLVWVLRDALEGFEPSIEIAFVYGSIADGVEVSSSDVDLFIVGNVRLSEIAPPLRKAAKRLGREVNPNVYSKEEFLRRVRSKDRFLRSVLDKSKLFVVGTEDDLREASRRASSRRRADRSR